MPLRLRGVQDFLRLVSGHSRCYRSGRAPKLFKVLPASAFWQCSAAERCWAGNSDLPSDLEMGADKIYLKNIYVSRWLVFDVLCGGGVLRCILFCWCCSLAWCGVVRCAKGAVTRRQWPGCLAGWKMQNPGACVSEHGRARGPRAISGGSRRGIWRSTRRAGSGAPRCSTQVNIPTNTLLRTLLMVVDQVDMPMRLPGWCEGMTPILVPRPCWQRGQAQQDIPPVVSKPLRGGGIVHVQLPPVVHAAAKALG